MKFSRILYKAGFVSILTANILSTSCKNKRDFAKTQHNNVLFKINTDNYSAKAKDIFKER